MAKRKTIPYEDNVVGSNRYPANPDAKPTDLGGMTEENVIGTAAKKTVAKKKNFVHAEKPGPNKERVAIYSERNVNWTGVGKVIRGYNIVSKDQADKWLTRNHIRLATPQEVAKEYDL